MSRIIDLIAYALAITGAVFIYWSLRLASYSAMSEMRRFVSEALDGATLKVVPKDK